MPFYYERPVTDRVTFIHRVTWLDTMLWGIWRVLHAIGHMLAWLARWVWMLLVWLLDFLRYRRCNRFGDYDGL